MTGRFTPKKIGYVTDKPDHSLPASAKEGIVRRRLVSATGSCPCGAKMPKIDIDALLKNPGVYVLTMEHEPGCPAINRVAS